MLALCHARLALSVVLMLSRVCFLWGEERSCIYLRRWQACRAEVGRGVFCPRKTFVVAPYNRGCA